MKMPPAPKRTTPAFAFSLVQRCMLDGVADREFGKAQMEEVVAFFGDGEPSCVYCGASPVERWDHLFPVMEGGDTVIGNMVPACRTCDDSKGGQKFDRWARGPASGSPQSRGVPDIEDRLERIWQYVRKYDHPAKTPDVRLHPDDYQEFALIGKELEQLRSKIEALIDQHRARRR
jgi:hypothetical protein